MKLELTLENKAKFFAQYWGQMVLSDGDLIGGNVGDCEDHLFLELRSITSITPEEKCFITSSKKSNDESLIIADKIGNYFNGDVYITDYLRYNGYALPFMGVSVDELVEIGWIKLKKEQI